MINLKQAFEDIQERFQKQIAEKIWEIRRIKEIKDKSEEWYQFAGDGAMKKKVLNKAKEELEERKKNLEVLDKIIKEQ